MCLVQKEEGDGRGGILIIDMFGSQREGRYFKINLPFRPYKHQRISLFYNIRYKSNLIFTTISQIL
jgi:hypothetical protein